MKPSQDSRPSLNPSASLRSYCGYVVRTLPVTAAGFSSTHLLHHTTKTCIVACFSMVPATTVEFSWERHALSAVELAALRPLQRHATSMNPPALSTSTSIQTHAVPKMVCQPPYLAPHARFIFTELVAVSSVNRCQSKCHQSAPDFKLMRTTTATPNHALQPTGAAVTAPASAAAFPPTVQPARQPPPSLSLGSFGVATRVSPTNQNNQCHQ